MPQKSVRRPKGMGNVYQRNGKWVGRLDTGQKKPDGKPLIKYFSGTSRADVNRQIKQYQFIQDLDPDI